MRDIETLLQTANAAGTRIVMTTHNLGQAKRLADDIVFLLDGQIHDSGQAEAFLTNPSSAEAKAFLAGDIIA